MDCGVPLNQSMEGFVEVQVYILVVDDDPDTLKGFLPSLETKPCHLGPRGVQSSAYQ